MTNDPTNSSATTSAPPIPASEWARAGGICSVRKLDILVVLGLIFLYFGLLAIDERRYPGPDPDRWYHYAISREMSDHGLLAKLPQVEDLNWAKAFPEKEFLFHVVTALGYRIGGDKGTLLAAHLVAALFLSLLYALARQFVNMEFAAALIILFGLLTPFFTHRLFLLRPHLAGMLCFLIVVTGLLRRGLGLTFLGSFFFALSYHTFYIPCIIVALSSLFFRNEVKGTKNIGLNLLIAGIVGVAAGWLVNPHFPGNIASAFEQLRIALDRHAGEPGMEAGAEVLPLNFGIFVFAFLPHLLGTGVGLMAWRRAPQWLKTNLGFLAVASAIFWMITLRNPRGCEYAVPLTILTIAASSSVMVPLSKRHWVVASCSILLVTLCCLRYLAIETLGKPDPRHGDLTKGILEGLSRLPASAAGQKLFNCDWQMGGFILYARPDMRFVDTLHPFLLKYANPSKYEALRLVKTDMAPDPYDLVFNKFNAQYTICYRDNVNAFFDSDPRFHSLFSDPGSGVQVFAVAEDSKSSWVTAYEARLIPGKNDVSDSSIVSRFPSQGELFNASYLDFHPRSDEVPAETTQCMWVRPSAEALAKHVGARIISIGGGPHVRLWLNRQLLYASAPYFRLPRLLQKFVSLPRPLRRGDSLEAAVCHRSANYWSYALSFWTSEQLAAACRAKQRPSDCFGRL